MKRYKIYSMKVKEKDEKEAQNVWGNNIDLLSLPEYYGTCRGTGGKC